VINVADLFRGVDVDPDGHGVIEAQIPDKAARGRGRDLDRFSGHGRIYDPTGRMPNGSGARSAEAANPVAGSTSGLNVGRSPEVWDSTRQFSFYSLCVARSARKPPVRPCAAPVEAFPAGRHRLPPTRNNAPAALRRGAFF
jgi:hypothetical protein